MSVRIPQFAIPFRFVVGVAAVNEQDSGADIAACVEAVIRCPQGHRLELPGFGVPDQTFRQGGADPAAVAAAVERWEPRAKLLARQELVDMVSNVIAEVRT